MQGNINCLLVFGTAQLVDEESMHTSEPLVKVYALEDIPAGTELLLDYGPDYFLDE